MHYTYIGVTNTDGCTKELVQLFLKPDYAIKKKTASIDVKDKETAAGNNSFKRLEYWGIESFF